MEQYLHIPSQPLSNLIENIFYYRGYNPTHLAEKILPEGVIQLIIDLTDTPKRLYSGVDLSSYQLFRGSWLSGQQSQFIVIESAPQSSMIVVRFKPWGAYPFFRIPMTEFMNDVVEIDDVLGPSMANELRERTLEKQTGKERVVEVESFFSEMLVGYSRDLLIEDAAIFIQRKGGFSQVSELANMYGISHKHFIERFKSAVGVTPKLYSRISRFQRVVQQLEISQEVDWADVVYTCGYFDQAHFIRDFSEFSGFTPTEYYPLRSEYINYVPIGKR